MFSLMPGCVARAARAEFFIDTTPQRPSGALGECCPFFFFWLFSFMSPVLGFFIGRIFQF